MEKKIKADSEKINSMNGKTTEELYNIGKKEEGYTDKENGKVNPALFALSKALIPTLKDLLSNRVYENELPMYSDSSRGALSELISLFYEKVEKNGEQPESVLKYFNKILSKTYEDEKDFVFSLPSMDNYVKAYNFSQEVKKQPIDSGEGIYTCKICSSNSTVSTLKKTRSADEPLTTKVHCTNCDAKWTIG